MKIAYSRAWITDVGFAIAFNALFFLPYIGATRFRVDQLFGALAVVAVVYQAAARGIHCSRAVKIAALWSLSILAWAVILSTVTPIERVLDALQFINSFAVLAAGVCVYILLRDRVCKNPRIFFSVSLGFSILINILGFYLWWAEDNAFIRWFLTHYAGASSAGYGEFGTIGAISQFAGRITSVFPHSQAYAVYNLMILALGLASMPLSSKVIGKTLCQIAIVLSVIGGIVSSAKTYTFCLAIFIGLLFIWSIPSFLRKPRLNFRYAALAIVCAYVFYGFYDQSRFLRAQLDAILTVDMSGTLSTRLGDQGYLVQSGTINAMLQPAAFILGMGQGVNDYAWSDNGYVQVLMFGGIFFFFTFYGYLIFLCTAFWERIAEPGPRVFLFLYVSLLFGNLGTLLFLFPRAGLLLSFFSLAILDLSTTKGLPRTSPTNHELVMAPIAQ